jgi:hypothetical protein
MRNTLIAALALLLITAGCTALDLRVSPVPVPTPEQPPRSALTDLGRAFVVVATSGTFIQQSERTQQAPANLVVWDDGLVTANVAVPFIEPPRYRSIQLSPADFDSFRQLITGANLQTYYDPDVTGNPTRCADCNVGIFDVNLSGRTVEIAMGAFFVGGRPGPELGRDYPPPVMTLGNALVTLRERFSHDQGVEWTGTIPLVRVARPSAGG